MARIYDNGTYRDMTAEEMAALQEQEQADAIPTALSDEEKLKLMLDAIPTADTPTLEPKVGYKWQAIYTSSAGFAWELVEDPNALGTMQNPLYWLTGKSVKMGYHYTDGSKVYVALEDGVPSGWNDETYFAEL